MQGAAELRGEDAERLGKAATRTQTKALAPRVRREQTGQQPARLYLSPGPLVHGLAEEAVHQGNIASSRGMLRCARGASAWPFEQETRLRPNHLSPLLHLPRARWKTL